MDLAPPDLLVFGGPSVHPVSPGGPPVPAGAGLITALAARVAGAAAELRVGIVCAVPWSLPAAVQRAFGPGGLDPGGLLPSEGALPDFEIAYDAEGRALYRAFSPGVEAQTTVAAMPARGWRARWIHVCPIGGQTTAQAAVIAALRAGGFAGGISTGTFPTAAAQEPEAVRALAAQVDLFFCNEGEAAAIFGEDRPGALVITRGAAGLERWQQGRVQAFSVTPTTVVDPTGAGDAVCGGWLAARLLGAAEAGAAERAQAMAALVLGGLGAEPLLDALPKRAALKTVAPGSSAMGRAWVEPARVTTLGARLAAVAQAAAIDFSRPPFPPLGAPWAIPALCLATLHQYGFWTEQNGVWQGSMVAPLDGKARKGSDFVWAAVSRAAAADPTVLDPRRLATEPLLFDQLHRDDHGRCPIPDAASHRSLQMAYGAALLDRGGLEALLDAARASPRPGAALLAHLSTLPGFAEDPLHKKASLLLLILRGRPDARLALGHDEALAPIVDYHLMRACLRTGLVVVDPALAAALAARRAVSADEEAAVREACRDALRDLEGASGLGAAAIDGFFFGNGRSRCLEAAPPACAGCPIEGACAQATALFQPVYRTTAY